MQDFKNKILNQRVAAHVRFIAKAEWDALQWCRRRGKPEGADQRSGLWNLSAARDLSCWLLVFPNDDGHVRLCCPRFFLPETGIGAQEPRPTAVPL